MEVHEILEHWSCPLPFAKEIFLVSFRTCDWQIPLMVCAACHLTGVSPELNVSSLLTLLVHGDCPVSALFMFLASSLFPTHQRSSDLGWGIVCFRTTGFPLVLLVLMIGIYCA
jgi:hypothetical protein